MITTNLTYTQKIIVRKKDTALEMGSGSLEVFATPAMVALMENTSVRCIAENIEKGSDTVGILISTSHIKATGIGCKVWCKSTVINVEGKKISFEIEAWDEKGKIGVATHERYIINPEKFMAKL